MPLLNVSVYRRKGHFCNNNFRCFIGFVLFTWFDFQVGFSVKCVFFFFLYFLPSLIVFWNFRIWEISRNSYGQKGKLKKQNFVVGDFMHVMWLTKMTHASQEFLGKRQQRIWLLAFDDKEYVQSEFFKTIDVILNKFFHSKNTRRKRSKFERGKICLWAKETSKFDAVLFAERVFDRGILTILLFYISDPIVKVSMATVFTKLSSYSTSCVVRPRSGTWLP